jgi:rubrerythrin
LKPVWEKKSEYVQFLRQQKHLELDHAKALSPTLDAVSDPLASCLLKIIIQDSATHASLCDVLVNLKIGVVPQEMDVGDYVDISQAIEEHIQIEEKMIKRLESASQYQLDDQSQMLFQYMLADERRHHNLLKKIMELTTLSHRRS